MNVLRPGTLLASAIVLVLGLGSIADASAQSTRERNERYRSQSQGESAAEVEQAAKYPATTRQAPEAKGTAKMRKQLNAMIQAYNDDKFAEARQLAQDIEANADANAYERSLAAQIAAHAAYDMDDTGAAMAALQRSIDGGGLPNNGHFDAMFMLAQLQLQEGHDEAGLATMERFLEETRSQNPQHLIIKGNTLYGLQRYQEAAVAVKAALDASEEPDPSWTQLLVGIYFELDQPQEAARVAEELLARDPDNKRMQLNLAAIYQQADQLDKAASMLERVRASGQLSDEKEYRQLYATYLNMEGKEGEAITVIEDGLAKGILKPNHEVYLALAQSYYFSGNDTKAIENYTRAAPLADSGDTYLNLARVLWQADRIAEAKRAAQQALDKGISQPEEARKILALPN
jgi:tetratricopeptide (TPR) repeat protein